MVEAAGGMLVKGQSDVVFRRVCTDSRQVQTGDLLAIRTDEGSAQDLQAGAHGEHRSSCLDGTVQAPVRVELAGRQ